MRIIIIPLLFLLFINACTKSSVNSPALQESQKIVEHIDVIQEEIVEPIQTQDMQTQNNYSQFYLGKTDFIYTADVPIKRIINILSSINPEYFEGVEKIEFIKTNKFWSNSKDGWYYLDSKSIRIFVDEESNEFLTRVTLHELKHHWCWINKQEINLDHQGCFLDTPIDKEYVFIR